MLGLYSFCSLQVALYGDDSSRLGSSLSVSDDGSAITVGANGTDSVRLFSCDNLTCSDAMQTLVGPNVSAFGSSSATSMSGKTVVVTAPFMSSRAGGVFLYTLPSPSQSCSRPASASQSATQSNQVSQSQLLATSTPSRTSSSTSSLLYSSSISSTSTKSERCVAYF